MIEIQTIASGSSGNAYLVTDGVTPILLECGVRFKDIQLATDFQVSSIKACLITHEHQDHCKALKDLVNKAAVTCYMSEGTKQALGIESHRIKPLEPKKTVRIGTWKVLPFDVQHDVAEPFGYLLENELGERLLFATDTYYIKYKFIGITHLLVECNYDQETLDANVTSGKVHPSMKKRVMRSHFGLENLLDFLKANDLSKLQEIHLLHLSNGNANEERIRKEVARLTGKMIFIP